MIHPSKLLGLYFGLNPFALFVCFCNYPKLLGSIYSSQLHKTSRNLNSYPVSSNATSMKSGGPKNVKLRGIVSISVLEDGVANIFFFLSENLTILDYCGYAYIYKESKRIT